ncbi:stage V sporulation protein B [Hydrogenoanaerobacterium saccharovorans]|uniref:Stage V sporulation protein B n=1 Tax=Hydrogenoanaerobacterium saccharovorans TaxID=474960 RepID=A0A1H8AAK2_9FIRM|nr:oligosaccharide flippase family protein [Hydrogenoanaerobacterium saccharovorans]RPF48099.1 stage V sporulation protein B [Hydrogenoanaerobacterium saccharovorans]SEM66819.1 stage V sporulation protein B [Hydrogenoanaerobacterium saccharovorans]
MKKIKAFVINAVLLTVTSLLMRTVGVSFGVYLSNKIGAAGIGLYQLIMSVYVLAVTLATSGVNLASTRLVAEELGRNNPSGAKKAMHRCLAYSIIFGTATAIVLFANAETVGTTWLSDERTIPSLKLLAVSLPFISMSSAISGYFTAVRRVYKSASAQVFEQLIRITLTIMGLTAFMPRGLEFACLAIVGGSSIAEFCSFFYSFLLYLYDTRRYKTNKQPVGGLTKRLLGISLPVAFSAYARSGLITIEHLLIPRGLKKSGASAESALASYGLLQGMVLPVILFPSAFLQALAGLLVPELAECRAQCHEVRINYIVGRVFQVTLLFSIGVAGVMFCYANELAVAIYKNYDTAKYICILAPLIPVMYLDTAVDGMLKGLGEQVSSMRYNIIDASCSVVLVYFLVPKFALAGYICAIFFTELLNALLSTNRLVSITQFRFNLWASVIKPIFGIVGSAAASKLIFRLLGVAFSSPVSEVCSHIAVALIVYLLFLCLSCCITREDIEWGVSIFK